ncbi:MAG: hypothetical protein HETSPECPRED_006234 [Heterodermia speciosa]|uniref:MARVEL domain-containing protein n=1 Tax=Heterodermia speciosa TaxID=116794 RepID=A0A8H3ISM6_9LECA|nr:MAG: hypothetical protein HETSPECPRED_006234 [Heterodermia speciosa]
MSNEFNKEYNVSPIDNDPEKPILEEDKKAAKVTVRSRNSSTSSLGLSIKTPRAARFAEATSVNSPIGPTAAGRSPFADLPRTQHLMPQPQPSDVGFGYVSDNTPSKHASYAGVEMPQTPASPLKSALRVPGTPGRLNPLSPTFQEEAELEKHEGKAEKENAKDLKVKTRVRMAKMALRGVNFSCSLIVLAMLSTTFSIFNATRNLDTRSNLPAWAPHQKTWPQITLLCIACVSLAMSLGIIFAYFRGGHRRAEKAAVYYTVFAIGFFIFSIIMWAIGAAILNENKKHSQGKDMWGWSCKDGKRKDLFDKEVDYALVCRLQNWSLICAFIEIIVEVITISIYGIVFYRFYSKRRLHKSMDLRDKARSDLYLAQLRTQSAPNTPGFPLRSPNPYQDPHSAAENGQSQPHDDENTQFASKHHSFSQPKPFTLQPPPIRVQNATPAPPQDGFEPAPNEHVPAAPGEQTYDAVPIPGAYASPLASPAYPPSHQQSMSFGQALTTEGSGRVESPPSSPRLGHASLR